MPLLKHIGNRPTMFFCIFFLVALYLSSLLSISAALSVIALLITLAALIFAYDRLSAYRGRRNIIVLLPLIIGAVVGSVFGVCYNQHYKNGILYLDGKSGELHGVIEEVSYKSEYLTSFTVKSISLDGKKESFKVYIELPYLLDADENDVIKLNASFFIPKERSNGFALRDYYEANGIYIFAEATDDKADITGKDESIYSFFNSVSRNLSVRFHVALGDEVGGFLSGILLGRSQDIADSTKTSFRYLGISHILSVSGLHLSILIYGLYYLLIFIRIGPKTRLVIITAFIVFFAFLTGLKPPVLRASIMTLLMLISTMTPYDYDPPTSISIAAFVIALLFPYSIRTAGFILSFSATAGIIFLGSPACKRLTEISKGKGLMIRALCLLLMSISISASATLFTLPAVYYFFSEISVVGVLANLIFVPICTLLLYLSVFFLIFYSTPIGPVFSSLISALTKPVISLSYGLSSILPEPLRMDRFHASVIIITFAILILCLIFKRTRSLALVVSCCIVLTSFSGKALVSMQSTKNDVNVICTSISGNDYILVNSSSKTLLCDFSSGSYNSSEVAASLSGPGFADTSFDALLISHIHRKHITMIARLSDNFRFEELYLPYPKNEEESAYVSSIIRSAKEKGITVFHFSTDSDSTFVFENCEITLFRQATIKRSTQPISMMKIKADKTFLYVGGAVYESDLKDELQRQLLLCNSVFFGIHGPVIKESLASLPTHVFAFSFSKDIEARYGIDLSVIDTYTKLKIK